MESVLYGNKLTVMSFAITELDHCDSLMVDEALKLLNRTQGQGLFTSEYLTLKAISADALVLVGFMEGRLVSAGCAEVIRNFEYYKPFDASIGNRLGEKKVGSLCALSVHEDHQGVGLGQRMTKQRISWLEDQECDVIIGVSWVSGLIHTSNRVFDKLGFRAVKKVEMFYQRAAVEHPFECPGCEVQPCECSAILYEYKCKIREP